MATSALLLANSDGNVAGQTYQIMPSTLPSVTALNRSVPAGPTASTTSVTYALTFNQSVSGVVASDFKAVISGGVATATPVVVSGSGSSYTVTINGIHGGGTLQLELVDNDTIVNGSGTPLGGAGIGNGSFLGPSYTILQTYPTVLSINRSNPAGPSTNASSVTYAVTFSEPVAGVDATDFSLALNGVTASTPVVVSGNGASYTVGINEISGNGTLGQDQVDEASIVDAAANPLQAGGPPGFVSGQTLTLGEQPLSVTTADVNGDGKPDLLISNYLGNAVGILLGNGNGTFQPQRTIPAAYPRAVTAVDLNGDGKLDLAVATFKTNTISVFLGNGNGTFGPGQQIATGLSPLGIAFDDLNGDGRPDLIVSNDSDSNVSVLLGNGNGTFQNQQTFATSFSLLPPSPSPMSTGTADPTPRIVTSYRFLAIAWECLAGQRQWHVPAAKNFRRQLWPGRHLGGRHE